MAHSFQTRLIKLTLLLSFLTGVFSIANAQTVMYPNRPIRMIVPYASGGPTDMLARALAKGLQEELNQPVIVENKPGAGSIVGVDFVAKADPDGYTLLFVTSAALVVNPLLNEKLPYGVKDFAPISTVSSYSMFLAVNPGLGFKTLSDLISYAKANPGKLTFGSAGNGTSNHLAGEMLKKMAGIELVHVPYKGNAAAMTDVIGGNISLMFDLPSTTLPHAKNGKVQLLGTTGADRNPLASDVQTIAESGVQGYEVTSWFGIFAPAKTDQSIINKLSQITVKILKNPAMNDLMASQGYEVFGSTPTRLQEMINSDTKNWGDLIRAASIKLE